MHNFWQFVGTTLACLVLLCSACSTAPVRAPVTAQSAAQPASKAEIVLRVAQRQLGIPYRYGGQDPSGFDCSGLVHYVYQHVGMNVPRTTKTLWSHAIPIRRSQLRPGDLVFFRIKNRRVSHVGIYTGSAQFIHAPSPGKRVRYASLDTPYWRERLIRGGRLL